MKEEVIRIDDLGASTHFYERYGRKCFNFWPLYNQRFFGHWGPFPEIEVRTLENFLLSNTSNKVIIMAITASWVDGSGKAIPFPDKYPEHASLIKEFVTDKKVIIASHGLTHSVDGFHKNKLFGGNRNFHREFWDWVPFHIQLDHLKRSKDTLSECFAVDVDIFVPPGNLYSPITVQALEISGFKKVNASKDHTSESSIEFLPDEGMLLLHTRDLIFNPRL